MSLLKPGNDKPGCQAAWKSNAEGNKPRGGFDVRTIKHL